VVLCTGCPQQGITEFIDVSYDHKILTTETLKALIDSVEDELQTARLTGILTPSAEKGANDLIDRLSMIIQQSDVLNEYVIADMADTELISKLIRSKWKGSQSTTTGTKVP